MELRGLRLHKFARGRSAQTIADQILVSASNFLTGIILVRGLGLRHLASSQLPMSFSCSPIAFNSALYPHQ